MKNIPEGEKKELPKVGMDYVRMWKIIKEELPELRKVLKSLLPKH